VSKLQQRRFRQNPAELWVGGSSEALELLSRGTWVSVYGYLRRDWTSALRNGIGMSPSITACQCPSTQFPVIFMMGVITVQLLMIFKNSSQKT